MCWDLGHNERWKNGSQHGRCSSQHIAPGLARDDEILFSQVPLIALSKGSRLLCAMKGER